MAPSRLDEALTTIDDLIARLRTGRLLSENATRPIEGTRPLDPIASKVQKGKPTKTPSAPGKQPPGKQPSKAVATNAKASDGQGDGFAKAWIAVGRVISVVPHPNSEKLYITKVDVGNDQVRQIVAGLQQYVDAAQLQGSLVLVVLNLKPAKLAGELSEGMILAATAVSNCKVVAPIAPSDGAVPGEVAFPQSLGSPPPMSSFPKTMKGDHWRKISSLLTVRHGVACYDSIPLVTSSGPVQAPGFPDASTIS